MAAYVETNQSGDVITAEGYPLAPFLQRLAAASIDAAFFMAGFWLLFFFTYLCNWYPNMRQALGIEEVANRMDGYQRASGLLVINEDGSLSNVSSTDYADYEKAIQSYYFVYNAIGNPANPAPHGYSIDEYNVAVCELPKDVSIRNDSPYYDFATDERGDPILGQPAVLKASLFDDKGNLTPAAKENLLSFYRSKYVATQDLLLRESYYKQANDDLFLRVVVVEAYSIFVPFLAFYVLVPVFSPYNRTLGKKFMKLCVIDVKGEPLKKYWLTLRSLPFIVTVAAALFLNEMIYSIGLGVLVLLISWGCASFTRKKRALHDFCAHSVVTREDLIYLPVKEEKKGEDGDDQNH